MRISRKMVVLRITIKGQGGIIDVIEAIQRKKLERSA
jgi:hypothetical protein